jgi:hypothetical protein
MNPFLSIWTRPKETFVYLAERSLTDRENYLNYLFFLISLSVYLPKLNDLPKLFVGYEVYGYLVTTVFFTLIGFFANKYILPFFIWKLGQLFKGEAKFAEIQLVLAYSSIPVLIHLIIVFLFIAPAIQTGHVNMILNQHPVTFLVIALFTLRNLIFGLSYFNKYSYVYAVLNIFIVGAMFEAISLLIKH